MVINENQCILNTFLNFCLSCHSWKSLEVWLIIKLAIAFLYQRFSFFIFLSFINLFSHDMVQSFQVVLNTYQLFSCHLFQCSFELLLCQWMNMISIIYLTILPPKSLIRLVSLPSDPHGSYHGHPLGRYCGSYLVDRLIFSWCLALTNFMFDKAIEKRIHEDRLLFMFLISNIRSVDRQI